MQFLAKTYVVDKGDSELAKKVAGSMPGATLIQSVSLEAATNGFFTEMIAAQTLYAKATRNLLAKKPEIDFLLRLAGTTQIREAIGKVGVQRGHPFLLVVAGPGGELRPLPRKRTGWKELEKRTLTEDELGRVERAALLNTLRA